MPEPSEVVPPAPDKPADSAPGEKKKKKDKIQAAWISFVGRVVAQILGAVASVVLGLFVLQKYQGNDGERAAAPAETPPRPARPVKSRWPSCRSTTSRAIRNRTTSPTG